MKTLDGLRWRPMWTSHMGCLKGCLDFLGIEISDAWLFGGTGHAFVINIHDIVCPSGPTAWNTEMLFTLGRNLGYSLEGVSGFKSQEDFAAKQEEAWALARRALDAGRPCFAWELDVPEYYVIHGCDDAGYFFSGPLADDGKGPKPWRELGKTNIGFVELYAVSPGAAADDAAVVKAALEFAGRVAQGSNVWSLKRYKMGGEGYGLWIAALEQETADAFGVAYNAQVWAECRHHAAEFLREAKERLGGKCAARFDSAITSYIIAAASMKAVAELFPFAGVSDEEEAQNVKNGSRCKAAIEHLRQAREAEDSGLNALSAIAAEL